MKLFYVCFFICLKVSRSDNQRSRWRPSVGHPLPVPVPQDVMVDTVNYVGLALLKAHNQHNINNNIALSPYGATSVLAVLGEGVQGTALNEITHASFLPLDVVVTRIGLRDIHRHLKSYFIPQEGFLAGLTFSHDNITLKSSYEDLLKFYGYDIESFNTAFYPNGTNTATTVAIETTTETVPQKTTVVDRSSTPSTFRTSEVPTTTNGRTTRVETVSTGISTSGTTVPSESRTEESTTVTSNPETTFTTQTPPFSTTTTTPKVTTAQTTTLALETEPPAGENSSPTSEVAQQVTTTQVHHTTVTPFIPSPKERTMATQRLTTAQTNPPTGSTTESNDKQPETDTLPSVEHLVTTTVQTTPSTTTQSSQENKVDSTITDLPTTIITTTTTGRTTQTTEQVTATPTGGSTSTLPEASVSTTVDSSNSLATEMKATEISSIGTTETEIIPTEVSGTSTTEPANPVTEESQTPTVTDNLDETNKITPTDDDNNAKSRSARSIIDYLIAKYHDDVPQYGGDYQYEPSRPITFAVDGKTRESNISFMTYDTILPFRYIPYLDSAALVFPLDSTKYYLLLVLPNDVMGIDRLIDNMMVTTLKQIVFDLQPTRVKATIPSFMLKGRVVLTPTFQQLGVCKIFEPRHADFSPMTDDRDIYVTNIEQAVTVTIRNYVDPATLQNNNDQFRHRGPVQFIADHPFLYFVMDAQIHVALMAGKITNPLNSRIR